MDDTLRYETYLRDRINRKAFQNIASVWNWARAVPISALSPAEPPCHP